MTNINVPNYINASPTLLQLMSQMSQQRGQQLDNLNKAELPAKTRSETNKINVEAEQMPLQTGISAIQAGNASRTNLLNQLKLPYDIMGSMGRFMTTDQKILLEKNNPELYAKIMNDTASIGANGIPAIPGVQNIPGNQYMEMLGPIIAKAFGQAGVSAPQGVPYTQGQTSPVNSQGAILNGSPGGSPSMMGGNAPMAPQGQMPMQAPMIQPGASNAVTPQQIAEVRDHADSVNLKNKTTAKQQSSWTGAALVAQTMAALDENAPLAMSYAGKPVAYGTDAFLSLLGKASPEFTAYQKFSQDAQNFVGQLRAQYGGSIQPSYLKRLEELIKPSLWSGNPQLAMTKFLEARNLIENEQNTVFKSGAQLASPVETQAGYNRVREGTQKVNQTAADYMTKNKSMVEVEIPGYGRVRLQKGSPEYKEALEKDKGKLV